MRLPVILVRYGFGCLVGDAAEWMQSMLTMDGLALHTTHLWSSSQQLRASAVATASATAEATLASADAVAWCVMDHVICCSSPRGDARRPEELAPQIGGTTVVRHSQWFKPSLWTETSKRARKSTLLVRI